MKKQAKHLAGLVEDILYYFGAQGTEDGCCGEKISPGEFRALRAAFRPDVCTMQHIAKIAAVTKGGATRIVGRLEDKGLVHREQDQRDGRVCCVTVTEDGKALLTRVEDQLTNKMLVVLNAMTPAMRDILIISLNAFLQTVQQMTDENNVDLVNK